MLDIVFLKALREKLKTGNTRSIHLNALPGRYASRFDITELDKIKQGFSADFLKDLLTKPRFEFHINFDDIDLNTISPEKQKELNLVAKRLNSIAIENEDNFKEHGTKTLAFGYPLLIKRSNQDPKNVLKAPLFIWNLDLVKSVNKVNTWTLLRNKVYENGKFIDNDVHAVVVNELLIAFLNTDEKISLARMNEDFLEDNLFDEHELMEKMQEILKSMNALGGENVIESLKEKFNAPHVPLPRPDFFDNLTTNRPWIHFGGVFGLFKTQKESIITDIDRLIEQHYNFEFHPGAADPSFAYSFNAVPADPSQQEILNTIAENSHKIIQGPPGTGKSQSLTALIMQALARKQRCMVVCEKKTALEVIKTNLHKQSHKIGNLAVIIEDLNKDRDTVVSIVRENLNAGYTKNSFSKISYEETSQLLEQKAGVINQQHRAVDTKVNGDHTWTQSVGQVLRLLGKADFNLVRDYFDANLLVLEDNNKIMRDTTSVLKQAKEIFDECSPSNHPLEELDDVLLEGANVLIIEKNITKIITDFQTGLPILLNELNACQKDGKLWATDHFSKLPFAIQRACMEWKTFAEAEDLELQGNLLMLAAEIDQKIKNTLSDLSGLQEMIKKQQDDYHKMLTTHYQTYYANISTGIGYLQDTITTNKKIFGRQFLNNSIITRMQLSLFSTILPKFKKLKKERALLIEQIHLVKNLHRSENYIPHEFPQLSGKVAYDGIEKNITTLAQKINTWWKEIPNEISHWANNISSSQLHPVYRAASSEVLALEDKYAALETKIINTWQLHSNTLDKTNLSELAHHLEKLMRDLNSMTVSLNSAADFIASHAAQRVKLMTCLQNDHPTIAASGLFAVRTQNTPTFDEIKKCAQQWEVKAKIIQQNLHRLREYLKWRKFYNAQSTYAKTIINRCIELNLGDWKNAFESWYHIWLLAEKECEELPRDSNQIRSFMELKEKFSTLQLAKIESEWANIQREATDAASRTLNPVTLYNKRGKKGERRNSLRRIVNQDMNMFSAFFPVVLVSPSVCSSLFPLRQDLFDLVIFDEASQLRVEDTYAALLRGRSRIVSGDSQQMPPSSYFQGATTLIGGEEESIEADDEAEIKMSARDALNLADSESLLEFAQNAGFEQSSLRVHYRSRHPYLIDFSNQAFYGGSLLPMPAQEAYTPIHFIAVDGLLSESTNMQEVQEVINVLSNKINVRSDGTFPSIGIATFNIYQRNLILEEIAKCRMLDPAFDAKMSQLPQDWFVKNLENIQGDERDVIIISTTYAPKSDGKFSEHLGPVIRTNGYKLLNVIITRAKEKVFVCSSIPEKNIKAYRALLQQNGVIGRGVLYAYLAYAKSVSDGNEEERVGILDLLNSCSAVRRINNEEIILGSESPFEEEVVTRLAEVIGGHRIRQQYRVGGFRIDMVICDASSGRPFMAIECDGAKYHSSNEAYAWDMFRQKQLEEYGFVFHRIWSTNWWHSSEKELAKLVDFIARQDMRNEQSLLSESGISL